MIPPSAPDDVVLRPTGSDWGSLGPAGFDWVEFTTAAIKGNFAKRHKAGTLKSPTRRTRYILPKPTPDSARDLLRKANFLITLRNTYGTPSLWDQSLAIDLIKTPELSGWQERFTDGMQNNL